MKTYLFRTIYLLFITFYFASISFAQTDLENLVNTEKAFAKFTAEKGMKQGFLEYLADDGILFQPTATNGKEYWKVKDNSPALLVWNPTFADISSDGKLGYTTGDWEFRPQGKDDKPNGFGQYLTLWQKQINGNFKVILDIGISHNKSQTVETNLLSPIETPTNKLLKFFEFLEQSRVFDRSNPATTYNKLYKNNLADDVRILREGKLPIIGKKLADKELKNAAKEISLQPKFTFDIKNLAYTYGKYESDKEKGSFVEIWKFRNGKWQIVLDIYAPIPKQ
jgi:ketosteroid isomerase-like protein